MAKNKVPLEEHSSVGYHFITPCFTDSVKPLRQRGREAARPVSYEVLNVELQRFHQENNCFQLPRSRQSRENTELMAERKGIAHPGREPHEQKE